MLTCGLVVVVGVAREVNLQFMLAVCGKRKEKKEKRKKEVHQRRNLSYDKERFVMHPILLILGFWFRARDQ